MRRILVALAALGMLLAPAVAQEGYRLNALDSIEVKAARWSPATGVLEPLAFINGIYRIGQDGLVDLPVAGEVAADGLDTATLAAAVRDRMSAALAVAEGIHVSVRVEQYAPVFVVGAVERPGSYEYEPGLTVLQAIAIAGGVRRAQTLFSRTDRDAVRSLGDHRLLEVDRWRQLAQLARLEAELAGEDGITKPEELDGIALADELLEVENEILVTRSDEHESALAAIAELKTLLSTRIEKLEEEQRLRSELIVATRLERDNVQSLVQRGLAQTSRVNDVSRDLAELETRMLELETAILTAEQQLNEADRDEIELRGQRRVGIITDLQDTKTQLTRISVQLETEQALFAEAARFGTTLTDLRKTAATATPTLLVTRAGAVSPDPFEADSLTPLRPGDVLEVSAPELSEIPSVSGVTAAPSPGMPPSQ